VKAKTNGAFRQEGKAFQHRLRRIALNNPLAAAAMEHRDLENSNLKWSSSSVMVPTVEREVLTGRLWSMAMVGNAWMLSTSGLSMRSIAARKEKLSTRRRCPRRRECRRQGSTAEPLTPVITVGALSESQFLNS
jgi:hypothetical protein